MARIVAKFNCFTEITILDITDSGNEQKSSTSSASGIIRVRCNIMRVRKKKESFYQTRLLSPSTFLC